MVDHVYYSKPLASIGAMDKSQPVSELTKIARLSMTFGFSASNFPVWDPWNLFYTLLAASNSI